MPKGKGYGTKKGKKKGKKKPRKRNKSNWDKHTFKRHGGVVFQVDEISEEEYKKSTGTFYKGLINFLIGGVKGD